MTTSWETLGTVDPRRMVDARVQLHWAAQAACGPGKQLLPHQPDYSEQSFEWRSGARCLAHGLVDGVRRFRFALRLSPPAIVLLDADDRFAAEQPLDGMTLEDLYAFLEVEIPRLTGKPLAEPLQRPGEGLPEHPVGAGARFSIVDDAAFGEVARWFGNGHLLLSGVAQRNADASPVRCWPHHFDLATLIMLDPGVPGESARTIGVGMSPGDAGRAEPYFYVTPWPYPRGRELPGLAGGGVWHTEGWTGAVLETAALLRAGGAAEQAAAAMDFMDSAIAACRELQKHPMEGTHHGE
jgi:hypothetical protein